MSVTSDGKFNFYSVDIISKNKSGKLYMQKPKNKSDLRVIDVDLFKMLIVSASNIKNLGKENPLMANTFDFLIDQIEMNEEIFTALLYPEWIYENKE